jgi:hypothetical protein
MLRENGHGCEVSGGEGATIAHVAGELRDLRLGESKP